MEESWDEPSKVTPSFITTNKWEGEDEDDDVKESWEDEDEEEKKEEEVKKEVESKKPKKKTLLERKIAEKEKAAIEDNEPELSPSEKIRMEKESDLKLALETTFGDKGDDGNIIDGIKLPSSTNELETFTDVLSKQLTCLSKHGTEYVTFIENLSRNLCAPMNSADIKKIRNTLDNLYLEKQKIEKGDKSKKSKGKGKAKLKLDNGTDLALYATDYNDYNDYDDFM